MLSALKLSALGAALALLGSAAVAGDAPAAYYPSLGYGQSDGIYEVAPGGRQGSGACRARRLRGPRLSS